jgi:NAD-dependent dihydropyrimidine dehydrogenase PreA subunit
MGNHHDMVEPPESALRPDHLFSRRQILKLGGISIAGASALAPLLARGASTPLIIMEQAQGIVIADPSTCVGCGRCELACTEFNDGKAAPTLSRIKVDRNINFGPGALLAWREGQGAWGSGLIVQDVCKQCPHPVPCRHLSGGCHCGSAFDRCAHGEHG